MPIVKVTIVLEQKEYSGLLRLAIQELRSPPQQVCWILRQELERCDLLSSDVSFAIRGCTPAARGTRVAVKLDNKENDGLCQLATQALRDPPNQLRWIVCQELERRGLLTDEQH